MKTTGKFLVNLGILLALSINFMANHAYCQASTQEKEEKNTTLYIVDGEPMTSKEVDKLNYGDIEKMEYVKEKDKIKLYTDDKNVTTVVLLTMKKVQEEADDKDRE